MSEKQNLIYKYISIYILYVKIRSQLLFRWSNNPTNMINSEEPQKFIHLSHVTVCDGQSILCGALHAVSLFQQSTLQVLQFHWSELHDWWPEAQHPVWIYCQSCEGKAHDSPSRKTQKLWSTGVMCDSCAGSPREPMEHGRVKYDPGGSTIQSAPRPDCGTCGR